MRANRIFRAALKVTYTFNKDAACVLYTCNQLSSYLLSLQPDVNRVIGLRRIIVMNILLSSVMMLEFRLSLFARR